MKLIKTEDAVGHILCHDITQIIKDVKKDAVFRKGHIVTAEDIPVLLSMGKENLYVWEYNENMLHENEAAEILLKLCMNENMSRSAVKEGKIELTADIDGVFCVDSKRLLAVNSLGEMMIASRHGGFPVKKGDKLAGMRVIPLVIEKEKMRRAEKTAGDKPLFELKPYILKKAAVITTGSEVYKGLINDDFTPVIIEKLAEYGAEITYHALCSDDSAMITENINKAAADGAELVICTGGMSVDPDDRTPLAIKNSGAEVVTYGAPVLPGAMFMLAYKGDVPVMGLPGCVMYSGRTVFDIVLPRILAGIRLCAEDIYSLGEGGLCLSCKSCIFPDCGFGKGVKI